MKNEIKKIIIDFLVVIVLTLIITNVIPKIVGEKEVLADTLISYSSPLTLSTSTNNYELYPMTDEYAINNLNRSTISIKNNANINENYEIILKVEKDSTIELENLKFKVEDNIIKLNNYLSEDEENYYYLVYSGQINKEENININYIMWIDENTNIMTGNDLMYSFEIKNI